MEINFAFNTFWFIYWRTPNIFRYIILESKDFCASAYWITLSNSIYFQSALYEYKLNVHINLWKRKNQLEAYLAWTALVLWDLLKQLHVYIFCGHVMFLSFSSGSGPATVSVAFATGAACPVRHWWDGGAVWT